VESLAATHCLDACAGISYLRQKPGAEVLKELMEGPTTFLAMPGCNLGAVYYDFFRDDGLTTAQTAWTNTLALPLARRRDADDAFIQWAGALKWKSGFPCVVTQLEGHKPYRLRCAIMRIGGRYGPHGVAPPW
jgi:hypothetical protein